MRRALAVAAIVVLAGCTAPAPDKAPEPLATRPATTVLRDALILTSLKARLTSEYPDSITSVRVGVADGVVTLRGTVRDESTHKHVVADAERTTYVRRVVDRVRVDPRSPRLRDQVGDVALATRIQAAVAAQLGFQHVTVRVERGVATLTGTAPDAKTKRTILTTARGTAGVRNVVDGIRVAGT
ncbi:MAG TPA: BON domain-containing protein [Candidatus Elarobacter sp.]